MIILQRHTISKRGKARIITIKKNSEKEISKYRGKDILVYLGKEKAFNSRISFSAPHYYIIIRAEHVPRLEKYFGKPLDIMIKLSEKIEK